MLYDVLIYEVETKRVDTVAGKDMRLDSGFHNASKRLDTVLSRINTRYDAGVFPAGKYAKGDTVNIEDEWEPDDLDEGIIE